MLISAMVNAYIFGLFAELVGVLSEKSQMFQDKMDNANSAMEQVELTDDLRETVRKYFFKTEESHRQ